MARWRAFDRLASVPKQRFSDEVILFADADGAFKTVDEDGVVTSVGSAITGGVPFVGVDPPDSPTDGELWWDPDDDTAPGGGSQTVEEIVVPFTFADADLLTGLAVYTPTPGDRLMAGSFVSVTTGFDGTTPRLALLFSDEMIDVDGLVVLSDASIVDGDHDSLGHLHTSPDASSFNDADNYFADATPLVLLLDDGSGGDPNDPTPMSQGEGEVRLLIGHKGTPA